MKLRTEISIEKAKFQVGYTSNFIFLGSCFAENIGYKMKELKFTSIVNPLGIAYNPIALQRNIQTILTKKLVQESELESNNELFLHFDYHGINNKMDAKEYVNQLNQKILEAHDFFAQANVVFISLGTANVFKHKKFGIVNNCHKVSNDQFVRDTLSVNEVSTSLSIIKKDLLAFNPNLNVVFTVSPIRHIRDGLIADRKSKSILIAALTQIINQKNCSYFPSYEIMVDDLRDYRFYEKDLIHPNDLALEYIWQNFKKCYLSEDANTQANQVYKLLAAINHKPFHEDSEAYKKHLELIQKEIEKLPMLDFSQEIRKINL